MANEAQTLRYLVDVTRQLGNSLLKKIPAENVRVRFEANGKKLNSVYWLVAHMTWAQNNLINRSTGGPNPELKWLKHFALGRPAEEGDTNGPSWEEVLAGFNKVHEICLAQLDQLSPEDLDAPNKIDWEILGGKTVRNTIIHHIRHENHHIGQLLWLVNLHGGKTI